jgi:hypothetical protein
MSGFVLVLLLFAGVNPSAFVLEEFETAAQCEKQRAIAVQNAPTVLRTWGNWPGQFAIVCARRHDF